MNDQLFKLTFGFGVLIFAATEVSAQGANCAPRDAVIERLAETFGESRQSIGLGGQGQVVETFASVETGTWTITITLPSGITCLVASGEAFERLNAAAINTDDDA